MNWKTCIIDDAVQDDANLEDLTMTYEIEFMDQYDWRQGLRPRGPYTHWDPKFLSLDLTQGTPGYHT